jgi:ParB family chromosome partitioning protein
MREIKMIEIERLYANPNNPRKELGDLTELAANIKERGILQPLTVVTWISTLTNAPSDNQETDPMYTVVIGHRRMAAAKLAGLTEVPCVIAEMTQKEQLATMLVENVQRSDLTPVEEAHGFYQLRFDMGMSADEIAQKTGYSKSKVYQRLKVGELDADKAKASIMRGATLQELIEVAEIEDNESKAKLLAYAGTENFEWKLKQGKEDIKRKKQIAEFTPLLDAFCERIVLDKGEFMWEAHPELALVRRYEFPTEATPDIEELAAEATGNNYRYVVETGVVKIYKPKKTEGSALPPEEKARKIKEEKEEQRRKALWEIARQAYEHRREHVQGYKCDKMNEGKMTVLLQEALYGAEDEFNLRLFAEMAGNAGEPPRGNTNTLAEFKQQLEAEGGTMPTRPKISLLMWYAILEQGKGEGYSDWKGERDENEPLDALYKTLIDVLGMELSDEEIAWRDGTHELYNKEE